MPRYHVEIVEQIKEVRVYEVDEPDTLTAAGKARHLWIDMGQEPTDPVQKEIEEREYVVIEIESEDELIEEYDEAVLLELLAEREAGVEAKAILVNELPRVLQLSTHNAPSDKPTFGPLRWTYTEYGCIAWPKDPATLLDEIPGRSWWWNINMFAFQNNCKIIEFDQANDIDERFNQWDW